MDDQTEIINLLKAYQSKKMTVDEARHSLSEMGYSEDAVTKGLAATNFGVDSYSYRNPGQLPASNNPDWTGVGSNMLTEKRSWSRTLAWPAIIVLGGITGWQAYRAFWQNKLVFSKSCQQNPFQGLVHGSSQLTTTNACYQHAVNPDGYAIAVVIGVVVAVIIAKLCYIIADHLRKRN